MVEMQTNVTSAIYNFVNNHRNNVHSTILLHFWLDDYLSLNHIWASAYVFGTYDTCVKSLFNMH